MNSVIQETVMPTFLWIITIALAVNLSHSYILLTANIEDVHEIVKQIVSSPVAGTLTNILRRASSLFNKHVSRSRVKKRTDESLDEEGKNTSKKSDLSSEDSRGSEDDKLVQRRANRDEDLVALGKNASQYLQSMKKIFEKAETV